MNENNTSAVNQKVASFGLLDKLAQDFKAKLDATNNQVESLVTAGGEPNVITAIKVNGAAATITDKAVDITVPTAVSALTNDSGFQTGAQVESAINAKVASTYKAGGSVAFAALPTPDEAHLGFVYNVTDKFTTTDSFVEGAGGKHPAGTNVAIVAVTDGEATTYKFDVLAGFVDLSGYQAKEEGKGLSSNDYTTAEKEKLAGIEFATETDYNAMIARVFGTAEDAE